MSIPHIARTFTEDTLRSATGTEHNPVPSEGSHPNNYRVVDSRTTSS